MDEPLREEFLSTTYYVCIDTVSWATIRVDLPLPDALTDVVGTHPWAFITAWNPKAQRRAPVENLAAQRELLASLQGKPGVIVHPGLGVGTSGWSEPSLFVVGIDSEGMDQLARTYDQLAYVRGLAGGPAQLRMMR